MGLTYQTILTDESDGVGTVTFNRPEKLNSYTARMGLESRHAIFAFDARDDIRAIVVTGAGRAFCAGADLSSGADAWTGRQQTDEEKEAARRETEALRTPSTPYWELNTPIIAAINGHAVGVGITMPLQWDIRIAAEDAKLGFVFNRRGVIPELGAPWVLPRIVGAAQAFELLVTGKTISGRRAAEIGLVNEARPAAEVLPAALEMARDIAINVAPVSASLMKRSIYRELTETDFHVAQERNHRLFGWTAQQPDSREGPVAFLEKRPPAWKLKKNADFPDDLFDKA